MRIGRWDYRDQSIQASVVAVNETVNGTGAALNYAHFSQGLGKVSLGSILSRTTLDRTWSGLYEVITECQFTKISS